jgi:hypothetical protein
LRLYSYKVARDFGFAPNPFYGLCTLATCKPNIRKAAQVGDWVVGTGSKPNRLEGRLVFAMEVSETLAFDCRPTATTSTIATLAAGGYRRTPTTV